MVERSEIEAPGDAYGLIGRVFRRWRGVFGIPLGDARKMRIREEKDCNVGGACWDVCIHERVKPEVEELLHAHISRTGRAFGVCWYRATYGEVQPGRMDMIGLDTVATKEVTLEQILREARTLLSPKNSNK